MVSLGAVFTNMALKSRELEEGNRRMSQPCQFSGLFSIKDETLERLDPLPSLIVLLLEHFTLVLLLKPYLDNSPPESRNNIAKQERKGTERKDMMF